MWLLVPQCGSFAHLLWKNICLFVRYFIRKIVLIAFFLQHSEHKTIPIQHWKLAQTGLFSGFNQGYSSRTGRWESHWEDTRQRSNYSSETSRCTILLHHKWNGTKDPTPYISERYVSSPRNVLSNLRVLFNCLLKSNFPDTLFRWIFRRFLQ